MELVVKVATAEVLAAALEAGVGAVARRLPRAPRADWWAQAATWQGEARRQGVRFYLVWDWLVREEERAQAATFLGAIARMGPDALVLRDPGLCREARRLYPGLPIHGAGGLGFHNSPGLELAQRLGFSRVVVEAPLPLKDLALMRRQTAMPLEVALPPGCRGFAGLCLLKDYLGLHCPCGAMGAGSLPGALEMLSGLAQLGVEAVQVGQEFSQEEDLGRVVQLFRGVMEAAPEERLRALAAAREVWAAFGEGKAPPAGRPRKYTRRGGEGTAPRPLPDSLPGRGRLWLEARGYPEAAALAREWRGPLVLQLTPENYGAFLPEHRRWHPRRLVFRLPAIIRETLLSFYRQALGTLKEGGYSRFIAGDWGGVALARAAGGEVYGDQTLGLCNSWSLEAARELGVARVCLPPGGKLEARELLKRAPPGSFWGYLYHFPALATCSREDAAALPRRLPGGMKLRWVREVDLALLCPEAAEHLTDPEMRQKVAPLVIALPRSGLPWGMVPPWATSDRKGQKP